MSKDINGKVDGKDFIKSLDECQKTEEVIDLLVSTMGVKALQERLEYVNNNVLINNLEAEQAKYNINSGCKTRRAELVKIGAQKFCLLTEKSNAMIELFKDEMKEKIGKEEKAKKEAILANRDRYRASKMAKKVTFSRDMEM